MLRNKSQVKSFAGKLPTMHGSETDEQTSSEEANSSEDEISESEDAEAEQTSSEEANTEIETSESDSNESDSTLPYQMSGEGTRYPTRKKVTPVYLKDYKVG